MSGEEFIGQSTQDSPLGLGSVLCLVNENMIDATIELEQHPRCTGVGHKIAGALDQVVEVEGAASVLELRIAARDPLHDLRKRQRPFETMGGAQPVLQIDEALLLTAQTL